VGLNDSELRTSGSAATNSSHRKNLISRTTTQQTSQKPLLEKYEFIQSDI